MNRMKMSYNFRAICVANILNGKHIYANIWQRTIKVAVPPPPRVTQMQKCRRRRRRSVNAMRRQMKMNDRQHQPHTPQRNDGKVFAVMIQCYRPHRKIQWRHRMHNIPIPSTNVCVQTVSIRMSHRISIVCSKVKYSPKKKTLRRLRWPIFVIHKIPLFDTHTHCPHERSICRAQTQ